MIGVLCCLISSASNFFFWSYHFTAEGVYNFETSGKNIQRLFDYAKEAGLWVIASAGPYCNAEKNEGGLALWGSDGSLGSLRTSDEAYHQAWLLWITNIGKILASNEINEGGVRQWKARCKVLADLQQPIILNQIENELQETTNSASNTLVLYMEQIEAAFWAVGITVPFTSDEKGERSISWSSDYGDVRGTVNLYGLDNYPGGFSCTKPNSGFTVVRNYL